MSGLTAGERFARKYIRDIVQQHGFVGEKSLQSIQSLVSPEVRREVEEALLAKDIRIGSSVLTLAKNLYTSQARFVFELLQNADDNNYTKGQNPYIIFRVYPDRIVFDCNEDGFTRQNLTAICDIGKSSKTGSQGYIGEKGIGFKSVFMAAWKVHIQSGDFSFNFVHRKGDSGMGMITPIWQEVKDPSLPAELTSITLYLHEQSDPLQRERERQIINQQFLELQDTLLLFLRKLRQIEVLFYDDTGTQIKSTIFAISRMKHSDTAVIEKSSTDVAQVQKRTYHILRHTARGLARSENRDLSDAEEASKSFATSEIILAFPVTQESETKEEVPVIEPQEVFAFLPVRKMGFNFLIQADFVTLANRQDIVMTSRRNQGLIAAIADAFIAGVLQLCNHKTLQYQWMRYLPLESNYPWDGLWKDLISRIKSKLKELVVFRSLERSTCRTVKDLFYRESVFNDQHGAPLFADLPSEVYLSDSYAPSDIEILKKFGLKKLTFEKIIAMVKQDLLAKHGDSRFKNPNIEDDWHTKAYEALNVAWAMEWSSSIQSLKQLDIIPLQDGSWISAASADVFYPGNGDVAVPKSLGMSLVDLKATRNEARCAFFDNLGIKRIDASIIPDIRERILRQSTRSPLNINLPSSVERMNFLFLTHPLRHEGESNLSDKFPVYNHLNAVMLPNVTDLYISDNNPYGADLFLRQKDRKVNCIHSRYFEEIPEIAPGSDRTLHQWMYQHLGIREHLRLVSPDQKSLSVECLDTANTRAGEFLGLLGHLWPFEGHIVRNIPLLLVELRWMAVLCMNGQMEVLRNSYLPLQPLLDLHKRYLRNEYFPFIQSSEISGRDQVSPRWSFLVKDLKVGYQDNVGFRLQLMQCLKHANNDAAMLEKPSRVVALYQSLDALSRISQDPSEEKKNIQNTFKKHDLIFVPPWQSSPASWTNSNDCLWDAPRNFLTKFPLKKIYSSFFQDLSAEIDHTTGIFSGILEIKDIDWYNVIDELKELKSQQSISREVVSELFNILSKKTPNEEDNKEAIRNSFETEALIYFDHHGTPGWHKPSDCVWSDTTHIHGKIAVNAQYSDFKDLFVKTLRVQQLDLKMIIDQLLVAKSLNLSVSEIKELLKTLNSFLRTETSPPSPGRLLNARIFPVREPSSETAVLCNSNTQFTLIDREGPPSRFTGVIRILDFTLQEIRYLKPLFGWTGLESRYLSRCMKEISRVGDGVQSQISQSDRDLKKKAYALLRIAAAFNSPKYTADAMGLYHALRVTVTLECAMISSSLSLEQDGATHEIDIGQSELHISDTDPITVYVPKDKDSQDCCFKFDLPHRLASWMMTDPTTGLQSKIEDGIVNVINSILNCLNSTTGRILEKEGIPDLTGITEIPIPVLELDVPVQTPTTVVTANLRRHSGFSAPAPTRFQNNVTNPLPGSTSSPLAVLQSPRGMESIPSHSKRFADHEDYDSEDTLDYTDGATSVPAPQSHITEQQTPSLYRRLLEGVVVLARRTSLPNGFEDISTEFQRLSVAADPFEGVHYPNVSYDWEHRKRVGVAGELFVFTILSCIQDLDFGLENWRSNIRGYASILPEYQGLRAWPESETSDIVYDDTNGIFTRLMISLGYLNVDHWVGKTPKYHIEVKCTMGPCATPCIVSQNQVNLMERATNGPQGNENQTTVYALFRVYDLGKSSMGLKIYVDPAEQRRLGKLAFTSEKYAVTPTGL